MAQYISQTSRKKHACIWYWAHVLEPTFPSLICQNPLLHGWLEETNLLTSGVDLPLCNQWYLPVTWGDRPIEQQLRCRVLPQRPVIPTGPPCETQFARVRAWHCTFLGNSGPRFFATDGVEDSIAAWRTAEQKVETVRGIIPTWLRCHSLWR